MILKEEKLRQLIRKQLIQDRHLIKEFEMGGISGGVGFEMCDLSGIPDMFWNFFSALKEGNKEKFTQSYRESIQELDEKIGKETKDIDKKIDKLKREKQALINRSQSAVKTLSQPVTINKSDILDKAAHDPALDGTGAYRAIKALFDLGAFDDTGLKVESFNRNNKVLLKEEEEVSSSFPYIEYETFELACELVAAENSDGKFLDSDSEKLELAKIINYFFNVNNIPAQIDTGEKSSSTMDFVKSFLGDAIDVLKDNDDDDADIDTASVDSAIDDETVNENIRLNEDKIPKWLKDLAIEKGPEVWKYAKDYFKKSQDQKKTEKNKKENEAFNMRPEAKINQIKETEKGAIAKIDKKIKKLEDKKSRNKNFKKKEDFEKKIKELDDDGVFKKLSEHLATHPVYAILTPGMNIAASAVLGLSKQDCDRIKQAVADFLMILSSLLGVPVERSTIERLNSGSGSDKSTTTGGSLLGNETLEKDFHNSMKKSRGINDAQRKAINLSEDRPDDLSEFDLDLFEIIANEEYQKYSADLKANIKSAKDKFKDFKYEIGKKDSSFDELTSKMSRIIQISDASDSNREERVKKLLLSKNFPWKNYFEDSRDMSKFIEDKIKHILDELEIDGFF